MIQTRTWIENEYIKKRNLGRKIMREKGFYERQIYLEIEKEPWSERKKNEMQKDNRGKKENGRESYMRCLYNLRK